MEHFDLAIVGGGIVGSLTAYLARTTRPDLRIAVFEQSMVGSGASFYSGGHMHPHGSNPKQREFARQSGVIFEELARSVPGCQFQSLPLFGIISDRFVQDAKDGYVDQKIMEATPAQILSLVKRFPGFQIQTDQKILAGCRSRFGYPARITETIFAHLRKDNCFACFESTRIDAIEVVSGAYQLWSTEKSWRAGQVISCLGPWMLAGPHPQGQVHLSARIKKVAAMHLDGAPPVGSPILYFFDEDAYLLPLRSRGHWILSFTSEEWDCEMRPSELKITGADEQIASAILKKYIPRLCRGFRGGRVFYDLYTPDRLPIVSKIADDPDYIVAGGGSGFGYRLAPAIAREALNRLSGFASLGTSKSGAPRVTGPQEGGEGEQI